MALTHADKNDIEVMIRKEIKDFLGSTTINHGKYIESNKKSHR